MTAYISSSNYKIIADLISNIFDRVGYINDNLEEMASNLYKSELSINNIEKHRFYNLINEEKNTLYNKYINSIIPAFENKINEFKILKENMELESLSN